MANQRTTRSGGSKSMCKRQRSDHLEQPSPPITIGIIHNTPRYVQSRRGRG